MFTILVICVRSVYTQRRTIKLCSSNDEKRRREEEERTENNREKREKKKRRRRKKKKYFGNLYFYCIVNYRYRIYKVLFNNNMMTSFQYYINFTYL